jgi:2-oxoisovalerate dehydrogenase E1 component
MAEMYGKAKAARAAAAARCTCSTRAAFGGNAIVGGGLPLAAGLALADKMQGRRARDRLLLRRGRGGRGRVPRIAMNLAALWQLPVLFCCENNLYAMGTALGRSESQTDLCAKAAATACRRERRRHGRRRGARGRRGAWRHVRDGGPFFLELQHLPLPRALDVRPRAVPRQGRGRRVEAARPDPHLHGAAEGGGLLTKRNSWRSTPPGERRGGCRRRFRRGRRRGNRSRMLAGRHTPPGERHEPHELPRSRARGAARGAARRPARVPDGRGRRRYGGTYAVLERLLEEFGPERIRDTPLSELGFVGAGIGAALGGLRPIVEVMTVNFSLLALDQIVNNAAALRHMSGGQFSVPLVIRMATGAGRQLAAQHSHSLEAGTRTSPACGCWRRRPSPTRAACWPGAGRSRPGADLRARPALQPGGRAARRLARATSPRPRAPPRRGRQPDHLRRLAAEGARRRRTARRRGHQRRGDRPARAAAARHATIAASLRKTHKAVVVDEGWKSGSLAAE